MLHEIVWHVAYIAIVLVGGGYLGYIYGGKVKSEAVQKVQVAEAKGVELKKVL